ncbi:MAG: hypothetical protein AAF211_14030 [Myxococcota bacterium]
MLRPLAAFAFVLSCGARPGPASTTPPPTDETATASPEASVTAVAVSGEPGAYTFSVTVASDETGCAQYADWWEVVSADGALVYRRILTHSHPSEQPFTRSGGPVAVGADDEVTVRAHLNQGYAGVALTGTVASGFATEVRAEASATELETAAPLPSGCLF